MLGTVVTLHAQLIGYEDVNYVAEWECADTSSGEIGEWQGTGISGLEYSYTINAETDHLAWRLRVDVVE